MHLPNTHPPLAQNIPTQVSTLVSNMDLLQAVFNHLVLPPRVPGAQDEDIEAVSHDVLVRMLRACKTINTFVDSSSSQAFRTLQASLEACLLHNPCRLEKSTMLKHFRNLQPNDMLILHVFEQNCALLIRRENRFVFSPWERFNLYLLTY